MRHLVVAAVLALSVALPAAAPTAVQAQGYASGSLSVPIDQSVKVSFAAPARDVVVGNPMIADVTLLEAGGAIVLGKEYGLTTVTAFDATGRTVFSRQVVVVAGDDNRVAFYRGTALNNFVCGSSCEQTAMPGEPNPVYNNMAPAYTGYSGRTAGAAQSPTP